MRKRCQKNNIKHIYENTMSKKITYILSWVMCICWRSNSLGCQHFRMYNTGMLHIFMSKFHKLDIDKPPEKCNLQLWGQSMSTLKATTHMKSIYWTWAWHQHYTHVKLPHLFSLCPPSHINALAREVGVRQISPFPGISKYVIHPYITSIL